jgi:hypothetical protein
VIRESLTSIFEERLSSVFHFLDNPKSRGRGRYRTSDPDFVRVVLYH